MPPKKGTNFWLWAKMLAGGAVMCVGGPMLTIYLMPTDEELFKKYNPELQQRSLERREERLAEFDEWLTNLKRQSKINKPIWVVQEEEAKAAREAKLEDGRRAAAELEAQREAMRKEAAITPSTDPAQANGKSWYQKLTPFSSSSSSSSS
ncbi:assembly factor cbp4 [Ophiostoma piceae UAMH 11346]|uniref:Cytochrome b mRNA-processing protein 4 n=1 Tax=Ophiostoma piceae (strain UAMH 11346) TaxID=1262450 RepID=S3BVS3_OPHP1|nr:assembly factor cbp4 [Ophiostoma piceae UAMH 11346]